jgi:hypothetical protein
MTIESFYPPAEPPDPAQLPEPVQLLLMVAGKWLSQCLYVAAELGIADLLVEGPRPVDELAAATDSRPDPLYRVLRVLAAHGVFAELPGGAIALTPLAHYLRSDVPESVRHMAILSGDESMWRPYGSILHTVRTGRPAFDAVHGERIFEYLAHEPAVARAFDDAMTAFSRQDAPEIAAVTDFTRFSVVADIGGGRGFLLDEILRRNPHLRGILFDQPQVVEHAVLGADVAGRATLAGGDFFAAVPPGADAYLFKTVLHDWSDDDAETILRRVRAAIGERRDARLLLFEPVIAAGNDWDVAKLIDIEMLVNVGGRERTEDEWRALLARAGFELDSVSEAMPPVSVIEAVPV